MRTFFLPVYLYHMERAGTQVAQQLRQVGMEETEVVHGLRCLQCLGVFLLFVYGGGQQAGGGLVLPLDVGFSIYDKVLYLEYALAK